MGDILSQNEIDELLKALNTGEIDFQHINNTTQEKKIRNHDFRRPSKFAKDHIRTLQIINDTYARLITNFLSGYLRTLVQLEVVSVEPIAYQEFNNSLPNPVILGFVDFTPLSGSIIFEISPNIAYALVDRILGGRGGLIDKVRGFTEIELAIIERVMTQMLSLMREPWENVISLRPRLEKIETNSQFAQIINPNETVALITFNARIGDVEDMINLCIPHMVVEPIVSKLCTKYWFSTIEKGTSLETRECIEAKIGTTSVPVKAVLGKSIISVNEFIGLQQGDVLPLDTQINGDVEVLVGDLLKFHAKPGVRKNKIALKISEVIRREEE